MLSTTQPNNPRNMPNKITSTLPYAAGFKDADLFDKNEWSNARGNWAAPHMEKTPKSSDVPSTWKARI